jgi:uncharacterized membrane protein YdjX (TVP38/TMEM64 family)
MQDPESPAAKTAHRSRSKWAVVGCTLAALLVVLGFFDGRALLNRALGFVEGLGAWGPVFFILLYVLAAVLFVPGSVLTLAAGALFGVVRGTLYVSVAATLGATAAFLVGRYLARDWVARTTARWPRFAAIDRAVAEQGWKIVLLTRLSPVFPFTLLNYAFGLTQVRLSDYVLASWIGMLPGALAYVYVGSLARVGVEGPGQSHAPKILYGIGLVATLAVTIVITRLARRALARRA